MLSTGAEVSHGDRSKGRVSYDDGILLLPGARDEVAVTKLGSIH